ncbi:hypothetical protein [Sphingosinicella sp.]|uniref:hypothetical protein n=1 Tax=Sphingosinicella sp. TaxID=1917971 RepID=UPI001854D302|nr:hypothetical protein [Sphingosinicella sp.]MBA4757732.1 hypothetical protein [Sphingosinicella sp.]
MKTWGDFLLGAVAGLIVTLGIALIVYSLGQPVNAEAWLSFTGALMGTAFAVSGAVWIEDRRRRHEVREDVTMVLHALGKLRRAHDQGHELKVLTSFDPENQMKCIDALEVYLQACRMVESTQSLARVRDAGFIAALREVMVDMESGRKVVLQAEGEIVRANRARELQDAVTQFRYHCRMTDQGLATAIANCHRLLA